jgi:tRNA pseudouridine38-40 synthase
VNEPGPPSAVAGLVRVRLDIAYDGTGFAGWARQPEQRTVQADIERALTTILRTSAVSLTVAGRTDAGVHAIGQVAHVDLAPQIWAEFAPSLVRRLAAVLAPDVRVTAAQAVPADFDARFSALWRRYVYRVTDSPAGASPLRRADTLVWARPLDVAVMTHAATALLGERDFVAFCRRRPTATTIRTLQRFEITRSGPDVTATVQADAFCHSMVRSLVGALLAVGDGRREPGWPAALLRTTVRAHQVSVAPARGLTLVEVGYPTHDQLAERAALTRRRRDGLVLPVRGQRVDT